MLRGQRRRWTGRTSTGAPKGPLPYIAALRKACPLVLSRSAHHICGHAQNARRHSQHAQSRLACLVSSWRPKLTALAAQHDPVLGHDKLRMALPVARTRSLEALRETEGGAEPVNRFFYVFVDKYGYHCCSRCRPVDYHIFPLTSDLIGRGDYIRRSNTKLGHCRAAVYLKIPHYALLLFALVVSLRWLGACWDPNVMGGAAILTSASQLVKQPRLGQGSRAVARKHGIARTQHCE
jgi:hypothetical protein